MSLKVKLFSAISAFVLMLSMLLVGVYAASQTINLKGEVNFNIEDTTLYVKDIRLQSETIENFMPGYINSTLDLNLGNIESTSGVVVIEIDMINTTETDYTATCDRVLQNANLEISGIIAGNSTPIEDVATTPTISGTITLTITYTGTTSVTLDDIALSFIEYVDPGIQVTLQGDMLDAYIIGEGNTEIIETGASSSNPIDTTISVPINTKICVIVYNNGPTNFESYVNEIDWSSENTFYGFEFVVDVLEGYVILNIDNEIMDRVDAHTTYVYYYAIINITENCTIDISLRS